MSRPAKLQVRLLPLAFAAAFACAGDSSEPDAEPGLSVAVEALAARAGDLPRVERVNGTVRAADQVEVRPELEARVVAVEVRSGDRVERGAVLVRLDDAALAEQLRQAEAAVRLAEAGGEAARAREAEAAARARRTRALAEQGLVSELDDETDAARLAAALAERVEAEARVEQARAAAAERRAALTRATVRSPVAGRVGRIDVRRGQLVDSGTLLAVVGGLDRLIVEFRLSESQLGRVEVGDRATIRAAGATIEGRVARISPFLAERSFSTVGEIDVAGGGFPPGTFVTVDLHAEGDAGQAVLVPAAALHEDADTASLGLWVVELGGRGPPGPELSRETYPVSRRPVGMLSEGGGLAAVSGLEPGEWVVVNGQHLLADATQNRASVRAADWDRILELQQLQREDVLAEFLAKQQRMTAAAGRAPRPGEPAER